MADDRTEGIAGIPRLLGFQHFDSAICRALYLSNPRTIAEYDKVAGTTGEIKSPDVAKIAQVISQTALDQQSRRGQQVKQLMVNTLLDRFRIEAIIRTRFSKTKNKG